tara:strand:+ start:866 stop:1096 length:231 start_codon:yes stop_codon:yes gene_type:complete
MILTHPSINREQAKTVDIYNNGFSILFKAIKQEKKTATIIISLYKLMKPSIGLGELKADQTRKTKVPNILISINFV